MLKKSSLYILAIFSSVLLTGCLFQSDTAPVPKPKGTTSSSSKSVGNITEVDRGYD